MICSSLFFTRLFLFHDSSCEFDELTPVDSGYFFMSFLIDLFFNFIFQHRVDCELSFIIYFSLISIRLS